MTLLESLDAHPLDLNDNITTTKIIVKPVIKPKPKPKIKKRLNAKKIDMNKYDISLCNELLLHCELGHILHVQQLLLNPKININYQNNKGLSYLMATVPTTPNVTTNTSIIIAKLLLKMNIDIDLKDEYNKTAFSYACEYNQEPMIRFLLINGCNIFSNIKLSLEFIIKGGYLNILYMLISQYKIELMLNNYYRCGICNSILLELNEYNYNGYNFDMYCHLGQKKLNTKNTCNICPQNKCLTKYVSCNICKEYGFLLYIMDHTRSNAIKKLSKSDKYIYDKYQRHLKNHTKNNPNNIRYFNPENININKISNNKINFSKLHGKKILNELLNSKQFLYGNNGFKFNKSIWFKIYGLNIKYQLKFVVSLRKKLYMRLCNDIYNSTQIYNVTYEIIKIIVQFLNGIYNVNACFF